MRNSARRQTRLLGGALVAASIAAASLATVSNVSADIGDSGAQGYIRVQPKPEPAPSTTTYYENQPVPTILAGTTSASAAAVQLLIPSDWESGDKIILQVLADGPLGVGQQINCLSGAQSISFAGPYGVADVSVAGPYLAANGWSLADAGSTNPAVNTFATDPRTPAGAASVAPTFNVALTTSPSCGGVGVPDQIELTFSNTSTNVTANAFELTFSNIRYNVGAGVNPGPVQVIPFARQAVDLSPGTFADADLFGGNEWSTANILRWTNNAYISPVTIETSVSSIVADNNYQSLGTITLTERAPDALVSGNHTIQIPIMNQLQGPLTVAVTGGGTGTAVVSGSSVVLTLAGVNNATLGTVTISGLAGRTSSSGTIVAILPRGLSAGNWINYLTPDDQVQGGSQQHSDVNIGADPVSTFGTALAVPARIGGNDRYETSAKIAANVAQCTSTVVLVSGNAFPDALSASYLAGTLSAVGAGGWYSGGVPVLLTRTDSIPPTVAAYIAAAGVQNVYIVGGTDVVSAAVEAALKDTNATKCAFVSIFDPNAPLTGAKLLVRRVAGADRYATNRAVVNISADIFPFGRNNLQLELLQPGKRTAIVATGTDFADALAAGPASYNGLPVILTNGTALSADAKGTLTDNDIAQVIIIGGTAAVSEAVATEIAGMGIGVARVSGATRYSTATAWADFMAKGCIANPAGLDCGLQYGPASNVILASGVNFADALSGGPLGANWGPIVLTDPMTLSPETQTWLVANRLTLNRVTVLGLGSAVSTGVMNAATTAIS